MNLQSKRVLMSTAFRREGGTFNAGSGSSWGVDEVIEIVNQLLPAPKPVQSEDRMRLEEVFNVIADISLNAKL
jgi:UDP-glucose 4-epimerase